MSWHSLYIQSEDSAAVTAMLRDALQQVGYIPYDPFPGGLGTPPELKTFVRHFVAPAQDGWVRILGEPDEVAIEIVSRSSPVLYIWLTDTDSSINVYDKGKYDPAVLANYLLPNKTPEHLGKAQSGLLPVLVEKTVEADPHLAILPPDMAQMINEHNIRADQASNMISRLTSQLFNRLDKSSDGEANRMQEQARLMLAKSQGVNWDSSAGRKLRSIASVLILPANWRDPDFDAVRDAYQVARRLQRSPNAYLMPDEETAIKVLPDAIKYEAVYVGK
jgi:hypothetical protein